jgi:hypothetical protein
VITIPITNIWLKIIHKNSSRRKGQIFVDICWNCWELITLNL